MRAKFVNEIVRGKASGIEALGIGKEATLKAWKSINRDLPGSITSFLKPMNERFAGEEYSDLKKLLEKRGQFSFNDMMWLDEKINYNSIISNMIRKWTDQWKFDKQIFLMGQPGWGYSGTECTWDDNAKIGYLNIRNHDILKTLKGYFIQYK